MYIKKEYYPSSAQRRPSAHPAHYVQISSGSGKPLPTGLRN